MVLWEEIAAARRDAGLSQQRLADDLGVTREAIARLELGQGSVALTLRVLADIPLRLMGVAKGATLTHQIVNARAKRKWTVGALAQRAQLDARTVAAIERGHGSLASLNAVLAAVAPRAARQTIAKQYWDYDRAKLAEVDCRFTPVEFIDAITAVFGPISLDPCAHPLANVPAARVISLPDCGLAAQWSGDLVFVNPPYGNLANWIAKANREWESGEIRKLLLLMPSSRLDIREYFDRSATMATTLILRERLRFSRLDGRVYPAPFSLALACFGCTDEELDAFRQLYPALVIPRIGASGAKTIQANSRPAIAA